MKCLVCDQDRLVMKDEFRNLRRVTSDCKPWAEGGRLACCESCGVIQKITDDQWLSEISKIYQEYDVYHQSNGEEQSIYDIDTGAPSKRSKALCDFLQQSIPLGETGNILDFGCANGEFISNFTSIRPKWRLYGYDLSRKYEQDLKKIPAFIKLYCNNYPTDIKFDFICLSHTLEHIQNPVETLLDLRKMLSKKGRIFIQVPNVQENPFDILVADHALHFSPETMNEILVRAGFEIEELTTRVIIKEISVLAKAAQNVKLKETKAFNFKNINDEVDRNLKFLKLLVSEIAYFDSNGSIGIFGSSISSTWISAYCKHVQFFVDEDPARIGGKHLNKPIYHPDQVDPEVAVYVPLIPKIAKSVISRYRGKGLKLIQPLKNEA